MTQPYGPTPGHGYPPPRRRTGLPVWAIVLLSGVGLLVTLTIIGTVISLAAGGGTTASPSPSPVAASLPAVPAATLPAPTTTAPAPPPPAPAPPSPTGPTGLFQHPEDVQITVCGRNSLRWAEATAQVVNHSGKASTYSISVAFENADGSQLLAEGVAFVSRLEPGQTTSQTVITGKEVPPGARCRLTSAQRTTA